MVQYYGQARGYQHKGNRSTPHRHSGVNFMFLPPWNPIPLVPVFPLKKHTHHSRNPNKPPPRNQFGQVSGGEVHLHLIRYLQMGNKNESEATRFIIVNLCAVKVKKEQKISTARNKERPGRLINTERPQTAPK